MTERNPSNIDQNLRLGIEAARTGHDKVARTHLLAVLRQDPDNIPAMLWLAFVLSSPQDTIRVLRRVLKLDPGNERAKAGIRWAQSRLEQVEAAPAAATPADSAATANAGENFASPDIRQQILSGKVQKQAKKGVLAHRARRTMKPLLVILLVASVLGLAAIVLGTLAFVPPETLAAWLPASAPPAPAAPAPSMPVAESVVTQNFASHSDTLPRLTSSSPPLTIKPVPAPPVELDSASPALTSPLLQEPKIPGLEPSSLIGPEQLRTSADLQVPVPVDNLSLAHQPAYPGEKWIEVNLTAQQVIAWEGDQPVFSFMASTGLPNTPTVVGEFHIYWKLASTLMAGPGYYLPEVPYTMYFYGSYALHGTYWHNNFGQPMSHGCVNLATGNAQKLFDWADPVIPVDQTQVVAGADNAGTLVVVHY
ncbi:MAG: L,D-transpeptidase [Chloroflexota bacterium]